MYTIARLACWAVFAFGLVLGFVLGQPLAATGLILATGLAGELGQKWEAARG